MAITTHQNLSVETVLSHLKGALWVIRAKFQGNKAAMQNVHFSSYFRSEFHFREETFTVSGETPFLYLLAFLIRLS